MSTRHRLLIAVGLAIAIVTIGGVRTASAATPPSPAQGIQISPVLIDLNAEKANSYKLTITVTNVTTETLVLKANVNDFRAKDESGNPEIILNESEPVTGFSLKQWIQPISNLTLKAQESRTIEVGVAIPAGAEAGGHYGVVRFSGSPPGQENANVSIAASVGVLVLARVNGTITESLKTKELFIEKNGKKVGLAESGPLTLVERIENNGNVHLRPSGTITVKNMFGQTTAQLKVNDPAKNVLPKSVRRFSQPLKKKWLFGRYTARLEASYGYSGKTLTSTTSFWVIPYRLICISLLIIVVLILIFKKFIKGYNQRIISRARNHRR